MLTLVVKVNNVINVNPDQVNKTIFDLVQLLF